MSFQNESFQDEEKGGSKLDEPEDILHSSFRKGPAVHAPLSHGDVVAGVLHSIYHSDVSRGREIELQRATALHIIGATALHVIRAKALPLALLPLIIAPPILRDIELASLFRS